MQVQKRKFHIKSIMNDIKKQYNKNNKIVKQLGDHESAANNNLCRNIL